MDILHKNPAGNWMQDSEEEVALADKKNKKLQNDSENISVMQTNNFLD